MATNKDTALTKVEDAMAFRLPTDIEEIGIAIKEELEGMDLQFDRIKIPAAGGLAFEVPSDDPDNPDMVKELICVIVYKHLVNAFWAESYTGQNTPPECIAMDGKVGVGEYNQDCASCPMNAWGSAGDGQKGKACKNMFRLFILRNGESLPNILTLPPTSIRNFTDYLSKRVIGKGLRSNGVVTKITLKKAVNTGGITYSQAQFQVVSVLTADEAARIKAYSAGIGIAAMKVGIVADDIAHDESRGSGMIDDMDAAFPPKNMTEKTAAPGVDENAPF